MASQKLLWSNNEDFARALQEDEAGDEEETDSGEEEEDSGMEESSKQPGALEQRKRPGTPSFGDGENLLKKPHH